MEIINCEKLADLDQRYAGFYLVCVMDDLMEHPVLIHAASGEYTMFSDPSDVLSLYYAANRLVPTEQIIDCVKNHLSEVVELQSTIFDQGIMNEIELKLSERYL